MPRPYQQFEKHPLWPVIQNAVGELVKNNDLTLTTAEAIAVGFLVSKAGGDNPIVIDWLKCDSTDEFYDSIFTQCEAPAWHGRNLDALNDSWVSGDICALNPPYSFWFVNRLSADPSLSDFRCAVEGIASESVAAHGGQIHRAESGRR